MKKMMMIALSAALVLSLYACSSAQTDDSTESPTDSVVSQAAELSEEEIVSQAVEAYVKAANEGEIEEFKTVNVKVYSQEEIKEMAEALADYDLNEKDIVFDIDYELKIVDGVDPIKFTAATGEVDGQWVKEKSNCGVAKYLSDGKYEIQNFGTGF